MRVAILGDIHGNLEALDAVLQDAKEQNVDQHACLGDIVGYGASPKACLVRIQELACPVVKGNHDEDAVSTEPLYGRSALAQAAMVWTRNQLDDAEKQWLQSLDMQRRVEDFTIVHASLEHPSKWPYVFGAFEAASSLFEQETQLCFIGHTHTPITYISDRSHHKIIASKAPYIAIEDSKQYLINVGSVGQPRDGNWQASYALYDTNESVVEIRRVNYDLETAQAKILEAGLPEKLAARIALGK